MDPKQIDQIRAGVKIPPQLADAARRIVLAGRKVMFSKETRKMVMDALSDRNTSVEERIGKAISDLMVLLWMQSNKSMPPQLVAPCATLLACDAIEFMAEAGEEFDPGVTLEMAITMTLERFGVTPDKLQGALGQLNKDNVSQVMAMPPKRNQPPQQPGMIGG